MLLDMRMVYRTVKKALLTVVGSYGHTTDAHVRGRIGAWDWTDVEGIGCDCECIAVESYGHTRHGRVAWYYHL